MVLCGRRNTFATVSDAALLHFSWQEQHFGDLRCQFAWQAQHFRRVVLRVFCESYFQRCTKWWQAANSMAGVAFCDMWWKSTSILSRSIMVHQKTRRKTSILELRNLKKSRRRGSLFFGSNMSRLDSLVFFCRRTVYGESCKPSPCPRIQNRL